MANVKRSFSIDIQFLVFDYPTLTDMIKFKAKSELHETDQKLKEGVIEIKKFIEKKGIPFDIENEDFMVAVLRGRKYEMKKVLDCISQYSFMRHSMMNYYGFIDMSKINLILEKKIISILPYRDGEGRIIVYGAGGIWKPSMCDAEHLIRAIQTICHFIITLPISTVSGMTIILDVSGISLEHVYEYLKIMKLLLPTLNAFPVRIQRVDVYNVNSMFRLFLLMAKHIIPAKLSKRIHVHGGNLDVFKQYPYHSSIMPTEFGGRLGSLSTEPFIDKFEKYVMKLKSSNVFYKRNDTVPFLET